MKRIIEIFKSDLKGLLRTFFALIVAGGLCLLPALYAWFNIYANWDPYSNTGNIQIAVANLDAGFDTTSGDKVNIGDNIQNQLKESDSIGWVFVDTEEEALDGVKAGNYYAAIVIERGFSEGLYDALNHNMESPEITYYVNDKKNAVATKITDTAVTTLQNSVNEQYIAIVTEKLFTQANIVANDMEEQSVSDSFIESLQTLNDNITDYDEMISGLVEANSLLEEETGSVNEGIEEKRTGISSKDEIVSAGQAKLSSTETSFSDFSTSLDTVLTDIETAMNSLALEISDTQLETDVTAIAGDVDTIIEHAGTLAEDLTLLETVLGPFVDENETVAALVTSVESVRTNIQLIADSTNLVTDATTVSLSLATLQTTLSNYAALVETSRTLYSESIVPQVNSLLNNMSTVLNSVSLLMGGIDACMLNMEQVFTDADTTLSGINESLVTLQTVLEDTSIEISNMIDTLEGASEDEMVNLIMNLLGGNPEMISEYMSSPVYVEENYYYEIENYGSGVAPFYTTLAIWVGMTILVSIIKVHVDKEEFRGVSPHVAFFGRYLMFFLLSQIQTAIIVLGNLLVFHIQCLYPVRFWFVCAMASLTFSLLIYALTVAFGDIGKAVAVVVMVIQIAGSGGTYPIEALPSFFQKIYLFFPFPYAIDGMRECIGGMYEHTYAWCIARLVYFCIGALVIGLVIRIPFIKMNHYFEKRMKDTEMM